jgi:hypothetical protein
MEHRDETRARTGGGEKDRHLERLRLDDLRAGASSGGRESARDGVDTV